MNLWDEQEGALRLKFPNGDTVTAGYTKDGWQYVEADFYMMDRCNAWQEMFEHANIITYRKADNEYITLHNGRIIGYGFLLIENIINLLKELGIEQSLGDEAHNRHFFPWKKADLFSINTSKRIMLQQEIVEVMIILK